MDLSGIPEKKGAGLRPYMKYYVYEDRPPEEAILHVEVCGYCNEGKGCHEYYEENLSGKWHGPFICLEQAEWQLPKSAEESSDADGQEMIPYFNGTKVIFLSIGFIPVLLHQE